MRARKIFRVLAHISTIIQIIRSAIDALRNHENSHPRNSGDV